MKHVTLVRRREGMARDAFFRALHGELVPGLVAATPGLSRLVVDAVDIPAEEAGLRPGGEPAFDAVIEAWLAAAPTPAFAAGPLVSLAFTYAVTEKVEKERVRDWPAGERSPGVKSIYLAGRRKDQSHEQFAEHWALTHAPLALKHHVGMWRYVRNTVDAIVAPGAPDWDGFAELHFRTAQDLRERFYDSDEGRTVIAADIAKFSGAGKALHTSEYIVFE